MSISYNRVFLECLVADLRELDVAPAQHLLHRRVVHLHMYNKMVTCVYVHIHIYIYIYNYVLRK